MKTLRCMMLMATLTIMMVIHLLIMLIHLLHKKLQMQPKGSGPGAGRNLCQ
uniref:Uncharacterized protein n=1 Tax=Arundo donax TaxID=35708 RepID=A0A0A9GZF9_ARUDO